ncbi:MAG TPA: hypothetical protein VL984_00535 [Acidimicrobiales bacterium]|nr:hypothetical protein [Acidimicrobiales bacterium]
MSSGRAGGPAGAAGTEELSSRLEAIAEELAEIAHAKLREAVEDGAPEALAEERRLTRARRSVLRAAALLGGPTGSDEPSGEDP